MNYDETQILTLAYVVSNIVGFLILWTASNNTKLGRLLFVLLFAWASWVNFNTARISPAVYLDYGKHAIDIYATFINGWFARNITTFITAIAVGQGLISLGMLLKGYWVTLACTGAILFLIGIAPLGLFAAFPFSVTVSIAAWIVLKNDDKAILWKFQKKQHR